MDLPDRTRTADVALRALAPPGRARVHWPRPCADPTVAALVVLLPPADDPAGGPADDLVRALVARLAAVVLSAPAADADEAHAVVCWAADHAAELGADPDRMAVVGELAGRVAERAAAEGWPPLRHVAVLAPDTDRTAALDVLDRALTRRGAR